MRTFLEKARGWMIAFLIIAMIPIPVVLVWMALDSATYSWGEALKLAGFTYTFELVSLAIYVLRSDKGDDD